MKIDTYLSPFTKLQSKLIKDLNIKPDTLNLIEEKLRKSLKLIGSGELLVSGENFLQRTPMAHTLRSRNNKWDFVKLERFCKAKVIAN